MKIRRLNENKKDAIRIYAKVDGRKRLLIYDDVYTTEQLQNEISFFFDVLYSKSSVTIWDDDGDSVVINPQNYRYVNDPLYETGLFEKGYSSRFIDFLDSLNTYYNSFLEEFGRNPTEYDVQEMIEKDFRNFERNKRERSNQLINSFKTWKYAYRTKKYGWEIVDLFKGWNRVEHRDELIAIVYRPNRFDYGLLDNYNPDTGDYLGYYFGYDSDRNVVDRIYDEYVDVEKIDREKYRGKQDESIRTRKFNFPLKEQYPKRRVMKIDEIRKISPYFQETHDMGAGILALVDVDDMGFCKDGVTRWYTFEDENGNPAIYFKY